MITFSMPVFLWSERQTLRRVYGMDDQYRQVIYTVDDLKNSRLEMHSCTHKCRQ